MPDLYSIRKEYLYYMRQKQTCPPFWREILSLSSKSAHCVNTLEKIAWINRQLGPLLTRQAETHGELFPKNLDVH